MNYKSRLNPEQIKAVEATEGAVLVLAGAGSGKTRVLTYRIANLIDMGVDPRGILAITFTNKAAAEMRERVYLLVGERAEYMWISTIHSMCVRILRESVGYLKGNYNKNFSIYSEQDKERVLKRIIADLGYDSDIIKEAKNLISRAKNQDISPERLDIGFDKTSLLPAIKKIYACYERELEKNNALDFDDLLLKTLHLLEDESDVLSYYSQKFRYVHVDEFQDTNYIQYQIIKLLSSYHGNIFVVGDDDQSIYGWRGAEIKNILGFDKEFKNVSVFKLEQNYRSTKKILSLANAAIKNNSDRTNKVLWTDNPEGVKPECYQAEQETDEAEYVSAQIKALVARGCAYSDCAVLIRINALSRSFEQEFTKYGIPFKVFGGFKFYERKEIKDLLAYLRLSSNPLDDEALTRIINTPKRGIGDGTVTKLIDFSVAAGHSVFDALYRLDDAPFTQTVASRLKNFRDLISDLILIKENGSIKDFVMQVVKSTDFMSQFEPETEENLTKKFNVSEFINSVEEYEKLNKGASLDDFLASVTLISDIDDATDGNYVSVATIHAVKGLEFKNVFICGLDETIFPISRAVASPAEMEEERRLMYVAITRAQSRLYLTRAKSRYLYGERQITSQSRFLTELSGELGIEKPRPKYDDVYDKYFGERYSRYDKRGSDYSAYSDGYYPDEAPSNSQIPSFSSTFSRSVKTPDPSAFSKDLSAFAPGKHVSHKKFGVGTIIAVRQKDGSPVADIVFKGIGVKSFSVLLAPMEVID